MSKYRRAAKIDANQSEIVKALRSIPGCSVEVSHDDILVGYKALTRWYEIKDPGCVSKRTELILESGKKKSQKKLEKEWTGHYKIVSSIQEILLDMGLLRERAK